MGASDLFDDKMADFSGMTSTEKICMNNIFHKCVIKVNEKGTEAYAVTYVARRKQIAPPPIKEKKEKVFKCNRPFLFFIHDKQYKTIFFMGKCAKPDQYSRYKPIKKKKRAELRI